MYKCSRCGVKACRNDLSKCPSGCPSTTDMSEIKNQYLSDDNYKLTQTAAQLSSRKDKTRLEETIEFCQSNGYKKVGIAFCNMLSKEAEIIDKVLTHHGFETVSIMCKVGGLSKEILNMETSTMPLCNPIAQAKLLNESKTDINIVVGLCIGHDTLFFKYSTAPVTVLAVKDRVLAHNPLGAVYLSEGPYKSKLFPPKA